MLVLHCVSALCHDRNTVDRTRWHHKITAQRGPAPQNNLHYFVTGCQVMFSITMRHCSQC